MFQKKRSLTEIKIAFPFLTLPQFLKRFCQRNCVSLPFLLSLAFFLSVLIQRRSLFGNKKQVALLVCFCFFSKAIIWGSCSVSLSSTGCRGSERLRQTERLFSFQAQRATNNPRPLRSFNPALSRII